MITRFKVLAGALGLVVATAAIGDASATTIVKHGFAVKRTVKVVATPRVRFGGRLIKHIKIVHRAPTVVRVVKSYGHKTVAVKTFGPKKIVRVTRTPLERHAMIRHNGTLIR